jgi:hypothetical protein
LTIRGKDEQLAEDKRLLFIFLSILDLVKHQAKYGEQNPFSTPIFFMFLYLPSHSLSLTYEVVVLKSIKKKYLVEVEKYLECVVRCLRSG